MITIYPGSFLSGMQEARRLKNMIDTVWYRASEDLREEYGHSFIDKGIFHSKYYELTRKLTDVYMRVIH